MQCIEPERLNHHHKHVNGSPQKPLIERRRRYPDDRSELVFYPGPALTRRAVDQMRIRSQHWIELADVALHQNSTGPQNGNSR